MKLRINTNYNITDIAENLESIASKGVGGDGSHQNIVIGSGGISPYTVEFIFEKPTRFYKNGVSSSIKMGFDVVIRGDETMPEIRMNGFRFASKWDVLRGRISEFAVYAMRDIQRNLDLYMDKRYDEIKTMWYRSCVNCGKQRKRSLLL